MSGGQDPVILDTLAAAFAEVGRFPEAVQTTRQALALATQQNNLLLAGDLKARLALYEANIPFRETEQPSRPLLHQGPSRTSPANLPGKSIGSLEALGGRSPLPAAQTRQRPSGVTGG